MNDLSLRLDYFPLDGSDQVTDKLTLWFEYEGRLDSLVAHDLLSQIPPSRWQDMIFIQICDVVGPRSFARCDTYVASVHRLRSCCGCSREGGVTWTNLSSCADRLDPACGWIITASFWTHCQTTNAEHGVCPSELRNGLASVDPMVNLAMIFLGWMNMILYIPHTCVVACQACEVVLATDRSSARAHTDFREETMVKETGEKDLNLQINWRHNLGVMASQLLGWSGREINEGVLMQCRGDIVEL